MIDPSLSSPVKWMMPNTISAKTYRMHTSLNEPEIHREEVCYPEIYHPEIRQNEVLRKENVKFGRGTRSLKACVVITFIPISALLYRILFSLII